MQDLFSFPYPKVFSRLSMKAFLLIITVFGVLLVPSFAFSIAYADGGTPNFGLEPAVNDPSNPVTKSYFVFNSKPDIVVKSSVRVANNGTARGTVSLYPVDATTGQTSGTVFYNHDAPRRDVGAWITIEQQQLTLDPGQSQVVPFLVTIPSAVHPGQHVGGIVAENVTQSSAQSQNNNTLQVKIKNLTIVAVQVNLPGAPIEQMTATGIQTGGAHGYQQLFVGLSNTGNMMLKPYGSLQVADAQGNVVKNLSLKLDTFLPQTSINYPVLITGQALSASDYSATLTLMYGNSQVLHYNTKFTVTQQQLKQVFATSTKTQAPPGLLGGDSSGISLWIYVGGGLLLLLVVGNVFYWMVIVRRGKAKPATVSAHSSLSQFKKPN